MTVATTTREGRSVVQILFSRKKEVDNWPSLKGGQPINYKARRNPYPTGSLSAMLCKACVVALKGDILSVNVLLRKGDVYVRSRSQSSGHTYQFYLIDGEAYVPEGKVTYHLGILFLAEALACTERAPDLLNALEELLEYRGRTPRPDEHYDELLMHLSDELYYWARYQDGEPTRAQDRLETMKVSEANASLAVPILLEIPPQVFTDLKTLREWRSEATESAPSSEGPFVPIKEAKFRGPQLQELLESLELGMHCLLVGPTATGKSLCAFEAFERNREGKPAFVVEGHESLREFDLLGAYVPNGNGGFVWSDGVLVRAMRAGGFLFVDEANRMPTRTINVLLGVLSRGAVILTEHGSEEVEARQGFQVIMAMNLGQGYSVNALDRALLDRFPCVLEFRYLSSREEEDMLVRETRIDSETARVMVKVANETRRLRRNRELSGELTPRGLYAWARKFQNKRGTTLSRLQISARVTWLHQVAGTDADGYIREDTSATLLSLIEAHTGK